MSDQPCNRCGLKRIRRDARRRGLDVTVRPEPTGSFPRGTGVYIHRLGERPTKCNKHAWYAAISRYCAC